MIYIYRSDSFSENCLLFSSCNLFHFPCFALVKIFSLNTNTHVEELTLRARVDIFFKVHHSQLKRSTPLDLTLFNLITDGSVSENKNVFNPNRTFFEHVRRSSLVGRAIVPSRAISNVTKQSTSQCRGSNQLQVK